MHFLDMTVINAWILCRKTNSFSRFVGIQGVNRPNRRGRPRSCTPPGVLKKRTSNHHAPVKTALNKCSGAVIKLSARVFNQPQASYCIINVSLRERNQVDYTATTMTTSRVREWAVRSKNRDPDPINTYKIMYTKGIYPNY